MPALPQTSDELLRLLDRSGLIPLERIRYKLDGKKPPQQALPFAKWMVKSGLLTTFQADQLMQGKSRGFDLGNYRVLKRLGGGATAGVFLCEHKVMLHRAAVKVLSQQLIDNDVNMLARFRREARAAAALSHPNIVRTIDLDEDAGRHFLVMEYVEGVTLDQWMKKNVNAPLRVFVHFILQAAQGLQHIHESGLIHRDLKPCNLLLDRQGVVKILDLGLAKFTDDRQDGLSKLQGANIMGTVDFMSPEQSEGMAEIDIRADIYSLGTTLYFLLTGGQVPFAGATLGAKMIAMQFQKPKPIREFRPDVDPLVEKIVDRMMAKEPAKRFQTPHEAVAVLQGWLNRTGRKPSAAKAKAAAIKTKKPTPVETVPVVEENARPAKRTRRRAVTWSLRAAAFLLVVGSLFLVKPWSAGHRATAQAPNQSAIK